MDVVGLRGVGRVFSLLVGSRAEMAFHWGWGGGRSGLAGYLFSPSCSVIWEMYTLPCASENLSS